MATETEKKDDMMMGGAEPPPNSLAPASLMKLNRPMVVSFEGAGFGARHT